MASSPSSETALGPLDGYQITEIAYDAKVVRWTGTLLAPQMEEISQNNQWIGEIRFPGDEDPAVASYTYQYYVDGSIASRQDARGVSLFYLYDAQGRIEQVIADYDDIDLPPFDGGDVVPADRIQRIDYGYDEATGEMTEATAYGLDTDENWYVVSESTFEYDEDGRLLKEYQQRGDHDGITERLGVDGWDRLRLERTGWHDHRRAHANDLQLGRFGGGSERVKQLDGRRGQAVRRGRLPGLLSEVTQALEGPQRLPVVDELLADLRKVVWARFLAHIEHGVEVHAAIAAGGGDIGHRQALLDCQAHDAQAASLRAGERAKVLLHSIEALIDD